MKSRASLVLGFLVLEHLSSSNFQCSATILRNLEFYFAFDSICGRFVLRISAILEKGQKNDCKKIMFGTLKENVNSQKIAKDHTPAHRQSRSPTISQLDK